ncbi:TPA: class I SAM-dependent methyltransferase [Vibrio parahaemolyticus]|uniref:class I SAM-dependent methyltransferase n=1 Tax=Vibrio harveyi group TaxID=717610 RepID=UPI0018F1C61C|nr:MULTISPECIES: class I SAM-dependent methyltransferase [Vibrio harveyi group]MCG9589924.1 class I SAM-dependent methyltransferase [Vibrio harveyi]MCG9670327.1 class I SAM-dependent methyltransferase [Vibrio harveyi]UPR19094.1 class I SAM-dependent methyltransferase [Vibrio parahaemolyticus]HAV1520124.1 class I SAM-dependent methyltransferase [Vibrio parahaemolyticus]HAV1539091.1 class I SAM-dependent methyltransferase [Vibrio parahaemolyticus]
MMDASIYRRPEKPLRCSLNVVSKSVSVQRPDTTMKPLFVHKSTECHVTPENTSVDMARYLIDRIGNHGSFLEPQCGTGNLIGALIGQGVLPEQIQAVEHHFDLKEVTERRYGINVHHGCFLEYSSNCHQRFDGIIANPPFKHVRKHMAAKEKLLKPDGVIIALVPSTFHGEGYEDLEDLPMNLFPTAKVNTKLVAFQS